MAQLPATEEVEAAWVDICGDNPSKNWYCCGLQGQGKNQQLEIVSSGSDGLKELSEFLKAGTDKLYFALLRVEAKDQSNSVRAKFVYIRFVGTKVNVMLKAKLTPNLANIASHFPVKHLTIDLTEELTNFDVEALSREFLRVGGAHKPDSYVYGPDQEYVVKK